MVGNSQSEFTLKIHTFIPRNSKNHFARVNQEVSYCLQTIPSFSASTMRILVKQKLLKNNTQFMGLDRNLCFW